MNPLIDMMWTELLALNIFQFFVIMFNQYFPYGMVWWLIGFIIFGITHIKTKNLSYASGLMAVYFVAMPYTGLITNAYSQMFMGYAGLIIGLVNGYYLYRAWRG